MLYLPRSAGTVRNRKGLDLQAYYLFLDKRWDVLRLGFNRGLQTVSLIKQTGLELVMPGHPTRKADSAICTATL